jgi:hypothetical protein
MSTTASWLSYSLPLLLFPSSFSVSLFLPLIHAIAVGVVQGKHSHNVPSTLWPSEIPEYELLLNAALVVHSRLCQCPTPIPAAFPVLYKVWDFHLLKNFPWQPKPNLTIQGNCKNQKKNVLRSISQPMTKALVSKCTRPLLLRKGNSEVWPKLSLIKL